MDPRFHCRKQTNPNMKMCPVLKRLRAVLAKDIYARDDVSPNAVAAYVGYRSFTSVKNLVPEKLGTVVSAQHRGRTVEDIIAQKRESSQV